jgi:hypothetical protein
MEIRFRIENANIIPIKCPDSTPSYKYQAKNILHLGGHNRPLYVRHSLQVILYHNIQLITYDKGECSCI